MSVLVLISIILLVVIGYIVYTQSEKAKEAKEAEAEPEAEEAEPEAEEAEEEAEAEIKYYIFKDIDNGGHDMSGKAHDASLTREENDAMSLETCNESPECTNFLTTKSRAYFKNNHGTAFKSLDVTQHDSKLFVKASNEDMLAKLSEANHTHYDTV